MKRLVKDDLTAIYQSLFKDFVLWGLALPNDALRDYSRVLRLVETRGPRVLLSDFVSYGKILDRALSRGRLNLSDFPLLGGRNLRFCRPLFARVFDLNDGFLLKDPDVCAVKALRQVFLLCKKVSLPTEQKGIDDAVLDFYDVDRNLRPPSECWDTCDFTIRESSRARPSLEDAHSATILSSTGNSTRSGRILSALAQRVADRILPRGELFVPERIIGRHGPGSVSDRPIGLDKFQFPNWSRRTESVFNIDVHAVPNASLCRDIFDAAPSEYRMCEGYSKLIPVPKTLEKPRIIASEPTYAQFLQGGIRTYLLKMIRDTGLGECISIHDQNPSRHLAKAASRDDRLATVDLSAASDRLSCWTIERIFRSRPDLLSGLSASRTLYMSGPLGMIRLNKYAPQGNATVFPVQSMVYAILTIASVHYARFGYKRITTSSIESCIRSIRVFGDDIVMPSDSLPYLSLLLESCQLKVNGGKSHYSGNFAESCGFDGFKGTEVTPCYLRTIGDTDKPRDIASLIDVCKNFYAEGLIHCSIHIEKWIKGKMKPFIPLMPLQQCHLHPSIPTFVSCKDYKKLRWNFDLQRTEARVACFSAIRTRKVRDSWLSLQQYYVEDPDPQLMWSSGYDSVRPGVRLTPRWVPISES